MPSALSPCIAIAEDMTECNGWNVLQIWFVRTNYQVAVYSGVHLQGDAVRLHAAVVAITTTLSLENAVQAELEVVTAGS